MWPNDSDGNAIRAALGPAAQARPATRSSTPAPTPTARTTTRRRSPSSRPRTARSSTPSRSRRTSPRSGSRPRSRGTSRRSRRSPRPACSRRRSRRSAPIGVGLASGAYWTPTYPYTSSLTDVDLEGPRRRLPDRGRQAVEPAARPEPRPVRRRPPPRSRRPPTRRTRRRVAKAIGTLSVRDAGRPAGVGQGPERQRGRHPDHRRPVGRRRDRQQVQARLRDLRELLRPERAGRGAAQALRMSTRATSSEPATRPTPCLAGRRPVQALRRAAGPRPASTSRSAGGEAVGIVGPERRRQDHAAQRPGRLGRARRPGTVHLAARTSPRLRPELRCRRGIGRAFQIPRPFGGMTVLENVLVGAPLRRRAAPAAARYERCIEVLELCGLLDLANRRAESLGLLHRKRLELARALATGPAGAAARRDRRRADRRRGRRTGRHDPAAARSAASAIVWIEHIVHVLRAGGRPAGLHGRRPGHRRRRARRRCCATRSSSTPTSARRRA